MKIARFKLSPPLLLQALSLPSDTDIRSVHFDAMQDDDVVVCVEHDGLKDVEIDEEGIPAALPTFTRDAEGVKFVGWGQE